MLVVVLILTLLNLVVGFFSLSSTGRNFIEREGDRTSAIEMHNAAIREMKKLAANVAWSAEELQTLYTSLELEREEKQVQQS